MKNFFAVVCFVLITVAVSHANAQTPVVCGTSDDTLAIQTAINAGGHVILPAGLCVTRKLDLTNRQGVTLEGQGKLTTTLCPIHNGGATIDRTGSSNVTLKNFRLSVCNAGYLPDIGILDAQTASGAADVDNIDSVRVDGKFAIAAWYVFGTASSSVVNGQFYNYQPDAITVIMTGNNFFGAVSAFTTIDTLNRYVTADWSLFQTEIHNMGNGWALWLGGVDSLRVYGGNMSSSHPIVSINGVMMIDGMHVSKNIIADGTTFYNDAAPAPACALSGSTSAVTARANSGVPLTAPGC